MSVSQLLLYFIDICSNACLLSFVMQTYVSAVLHRVNFPLFFLILPQVGQRVCMLVKQGVPWTILSSMFQLILLMLAMVGFCILSCFILIFLLKLATIFFLLIRWYWCNLMFSQYLDFWIWFDLFLAWYTEHIQDIVG